MCIRIIRNIAKQEALAAFGALHNVSQPYCTDSLDAEKRYIPHEYGFAVAEKELSSEEKTARLKEVMPWEDSK